MATFAQLLTEHIRRSGITDAELARTIGVRRQTIFRWKEGIVARPRHKDDVLRCAQRLRLTPQERDALLLAAGFPSDSPVVDDDGTQEIDSTLPDAHVRDDEQEVGPSADLTLAEASTNPLSAGSRGSLLSRRPLFWLALVLVSVVGIVLAPGAMERFRPTPIATLPATPVPTVHPKSTTTPHPTPIAIVAEPGETLVLVARFANYAQGLSFNAAGRIREALEDEIGEAGLQNTAVSIWPEPILDQAAAAAVIATSDAAMLIWGEYDSGRVKVSLETSAAERDEWEQSSPSTEALIAIINVEMSEQVRSIALLTLGRLYRTTNDRTNAVAAFRRGLEEPELEPYTARALKFYLASVLLRGTVAEIDEAIMLYTELVEAYPELTNAWRNRGKAYLNRFYARPDRTHDLDAAIEDLTVTLRLDSKDETALLDRAAAYYARNAREDSVRALIDLDRLLQLQPGHRRALFNRSLVRIRQGKDPTWDSDLLTLLESDPGHASAETALCWGYALDGRAEESLIHCDRAFALGVDIAARDGRGIALAQLGRYDEAIIDLEAYVDGLRQQSEESYIFRRGPEVETWLEALERGEMPFTEEVLDSLR